MKIVIFNEELRSEMQMYLTLCDRHKVEIAQDLEELMKLLEEEVTDLTFLDLAPASETEGTIDPFEVARKVLEKHPQIKVVGICDHDDQSLQKAAADHGIEKVITRPIKNRDLLEALTN
jgi:DNA-binding NarL/FixJ family response regulator